MTTALCVCCQLYTVSQDGTLCVWQSNTELDALVLNKNQSRKTLRPGDEEEEEEEEDEEGEGVVRGKPEAPKQTKTKNVRYKQMSK